MEARVPLRHIFDLLGVDVTTVLGPVDLSVASARSLAIAGPESITFCKFSGQQAIEAVNSTKAAVVLVQSTDEWESDATIIKVPDARLAFLRVVREFFARLPTPGIHPTAVIGPEAVVDPSASIGPYCVIDQATIGPNSHLMSHVTIASPATIGANVTIHSGAVIGADGFGFQRNESGELEKFPHIGGVRIEDDVEIGANACVDRGTLSDTVIHAGVKIDNLVHVAHNVEIGHHSAIIANSMLAGSVKIGRHAWVAPSANIMNQAVIGDGAIVGLAAVVVSDVPEGETVMGSPARPAEEFKATLRAIKNLPASLDSVSNETQDTFGGDPL